VSAGRWYTPSGCACALSVSQGSVRGPGGAYSAPSLERWPWAISGTPRWGELSTRHDPTERVAACRPYTERSSLVFIFRVLGGSPAERLDRPRARSPPQAEERMTKPETPNDERTTKPKCRRAASAASCGGGHCASIPSGFGLWASFVIGYFGLRHCVACECAQRECDGAWPSVATGVSPVEGSRTALQFLFHRRDACGYVCPS